MRLKGRTWSFSGGQDGFYRVMDDLFDKIKDRRGMDFEITFFDRDGNITTREYVNKSTLEVRELIETAIGEIDQYEQEGQDEMDPSLGEFLDEEEYDEVVEFFPMTVKITDGGRKSR